MKRILPLFALALLAACGSRGDLEPPEGKPLPPAPAGARETPKAGDLIEPEPQARPGRSDELLRESKERDDDPFDLPPAR